MNDIILHTIEFIGNIHDGDDVIVATLRQVYYRTNIAGDKTLYMTRVDGSSLLKYERIGESNQYKFYEEV